MDNNARKANSAEKRAKKVTLALLHYIAHATLKGELDMAEIRAALRPTYKRRVHKRNPSTDHKPSDLLTPEQAGRILKQSPKTLANKRSQGNGPRYIKLSHRAVRYRYQDLIDFAENGSRMNTSEPFPAAGADKKKKTSKSHSQGKPLRNDLSVIPSGSSKPRNKAVDGKKKRRQKAKT
jgi:hypothetical protein